MDKPKTCFHIEGGCMTIGQLKEVLEDYPDDGQVKIAIFTGMTFPVKEAFPLEENNILLEAGEMPPRPG
jgi:hypothetical protein